MHRVCYRCSVFSFVFVFSLIAINPLVSTDLFGSDWDAMKAIVPRGYVCNRSMTPISLDGKLDDAAWQKSTWTEDFVDIEGTVKPLPRQRTRAKMLWDNDYLYIAAELSETDVQGTIDQHDAVIFQDNDFEVFIDPDGDHHRYYEMELNAKNTTWDLFLPKPYKDGGSADNSFELTGMKTAIHINGTINDPNDRDVGWTVEIAIPWKSIPDRPNAKQPPSDGEQWRMGFSRVEWQWEIVDGKYRKIPNTKEDNWIWSPQGIIDMHRPERWGYVQFNATTDTSKSFERQPSNAIEDALMAVYHRQKDFHQANARYAKSLAELPDLGDTSSIHMYETSTGYQASMSVPGSSDALDRLHVCQDSRLWSTHDNPRTLGAIKKAGSNESQIRAALDLVPLEHRDGMEFLIEFMPERDLKSLTAEFLLENDRLAYQAWDDAPWKADIPKEVFFNNVLPYASINEQRDSWRKDFQERFKPLIAGAKTPSQAAAMLNQKVFPLVKVRYSTQRNKADQSPIESMKSGLASCTGLSVLLIDACRSLGIPARFVGTPLWSDKSGNHSWIEVWDNGWHFTGAAEPSGDELDKAWFLDRAATAKRDDAMNAIYAVSYQHTPIHFPLVWDRSIDYIYAVNVTDRYVERGEKQPAGTSNIMFRVLERDGGGRVSAKIQIIDSSGTIVLDGLTKDERFDANDHLRCFLPTGNEYELVVRYADHEHKSRFRAEQLAAPITIFLNRD